ncbi:MAG: lipid IV(A) 3-deoxy-D-manno-octulosonic acid transferase [Xanthomonadales bacterium]|nr:lipid IV(A) 3-deoxy-D-manno-octulosonic acid transferase [Xanthomonadales bacterium]
MPGPTPIKQPHSWPTRLRLLLLRLVYTTFIYLATPIILYRLLVRGLKLRSYLQRWSERFGHFPRPGFPTDSIWVHAVSVGELNAAIPLIHALRERYRDWPMVVTTVTPTGSERLRQVFGDSIFHVYLPYDIPAAVRRFLDRVRPRLAVIMETEIWPNLYFICRRRGIPVVIANARLSERSLRGYGPVQPLAGEAIRSATFIAAQSQTDYDRFLSLGAQPERLAMVGNLKFDYELPEATVTAGATWRAQAGADRPIWVAASTHEGEEQAVLTAHAQVLQRFPDALLVLAPRHPERFRAVANAAEAAGLQVRTRSEHQVAEPGTQCFVADSLGELMTFFAACDVAFVAGSLEPIGGHNVLEPALAGRAIVVGPHTFNFAEVTDLLLEAGAALRVDGPEGLAPAVIELFEDPARCADMGRRGAALIAAERGALERTLAVIRHIAG